MQRNMIAVALLPPLVALIFISIWRVAALFVRFLRAVRKKRQSTPCSTESSRAAAKEMLEKARNEFEDEQALRGPNTVTMNWPTVTRYEDLR